MANNQYQQSVDQVNSSLDKMYSKWKDIDALILKTSEDARKSVGKDFSSGLPKDLNERLKKNAQYNEQVNAALAEQQRLEKALIAQIAKKDASLESTNRALIKQRFETQQINKANKENAVLTSKLSTFYQKQNVILNKLTRRRQDLLLKQELGIKLDRKESRELDKLTKAQLKLDRAFKKTDDAVGRNQRSVGKYAIALKGLRGVVTGLLGAFGVIEGVRLAFNFTKEAIAMAREIKGVDFAFRQLGERGVKAFQDIKKQTRGLLSDRAIKTAINEFDQFNLSLEQAGTLFEFLAVASAQTGKSVDELKSSLVEGLSKESKLRIDNLGISTAELNAELEKTPVFIDAVANIAERKIAKAGDILDETANQGERLTASFENSKIAFGQLFEGNSIGLLGKLSKEFDKVTIGLRLLKDAFLTAKQGLNDFLDPIVSLIRDIPIVGRIFDGVTGRVNNFIKAFFSISPITAFGIVLKNIGATLSGLGAGFTAAKNEAINFIDIISKIEDISLNPFKGGKQAKEIFGELVSASANGGKAVAEAYVTARDEALKASSKDSGSGVLPSIKSQDQEDFRKETEQVVSVFELLNVAAVDLKAKIGDLFVKGLIDAGQYEQALKRIERATKDITEGISAVEGGDFDLFGTLAPDSIKESVTVLEDALNNLPWEDALQKATDFFGEVSNLSNTLFDRNIQQIDDEINRNDEKYTQILASEELSQERRAVLEAEQEANRVKLEKQKRKEQRKQAVITKAFRASEVIANTAVAISKTLADTGILGIPLTTIIAAQGAIQLANVLAQPIPQFKDGLFEDYEGKGIINDEKGSRYKEILFRKNGSIEMFNQRNKVVDIKKGDRIAPAKLSQDIINNSVSMHNASQADKLSAMQAQAPLVNVMIGEEVSRITKAIKAIPKQDTGSLASEIVDALKYNNLLDF